MINFLKNNKIILCSVPLVMLAVIAMIEGFIYKPYYNSEVWNVVYCSFALFVCIFIFCFWFFVYGFELKTKCIWIFTSITSVALIAVYAIILMVVALYSGTDISYTFSIALIDVLLLVALTYVVTKLNQKKITAIIIPIAMCIIIAGLSVYAGVHSNRVVMDFTMKDTLLDGNGKPVKVILLAGQSNGSGYSRVSYLKERLDASEFESLDKGFSNVFINYFNDNGKNSSDCFVRVRTDQGFSNGFFGPELGMGSVLSAAYAEEDVYIIKCCWGGTNLYKQWLSPSADGPTGDLYTQFIAFVSQSLDYLRSRNYNPSIEAICWMQGESDSGNAVCKKYESNLSNLVSDFRTDLSKYASPTGILFVDGGISDSHLWGNYEAINAAKKAVSQQSPLNVYFENYDLSYSAEPANAPDTAHFDSVEALELGKRFGRNCLEGITQKNKG